MSEEFPSGIGLVDISLLAPTNKVQTSRLAILSTRKPLNSQIIQNLDITTAEPYNI